MNQQPEEPPDAVKTARAAVERYLKDQAAEEQLRADTAAGKLAQWQETGSTDDDLVEEAVQAQWGRVRELGYHPGSDSWVTGEEQLRKEYARRWCAAASTEDGAKQLGYDVEVDRLAPLQDDVEIARAAIGDHLTTHLAADAPEWDAHHAARLAWEGEPDPAKRRVDHATAKRVDTAAYAAVQKLRFDDPDRPAAVLHYNAVNRGLRFLRHPVAERQITVVDVTDGA
ncbi:hypothetical protein [Streptomyces alboflavus]|uniref:hypothetical protein n=1 Tax=Streptomyces alboflavus TaxID=67267 RepID=UPI000F656CDE|nr:hypothetical protein [Streptomyces alboflavus]